MAAVQPMPVTASIAAYASHPYGGFWIRVVAAIIDSLIIQIIVFPLALGFGVGLGLAGATVNMPGEGVRMVGLMTGFALSVFIMWLYEALMTSSSKQATVGKLALGLRVTDLAGNRISFGRATARVLSKYVSSAILFIGYLMVAFTDRKQGLHDMIAGTLVQKTR
jgi:uncharacterized RDD family membrane protein YckC